MSSLTDKAFIAASTKDFDKAALGNKTSLEEAAQITGLTVDQIRQSADWIAQPKQGGARRRTMFAYEKDLIWGNDNYRINGALVNVALATGNIGRPGGGCLCMGGHQEGYSRPSDAHVGRPAAYVDQLLIEGKGGVHHIRGCDHYKTTARPRPSSIRWRRPSASRPSCCSPIRPACREMWSQRESMSSRASPGFVGRGAHRTRKSPR